MEGNGKLVQFIFNENKEVIAEKEDGNITRLIRTIELGAMEAEPEKTWYHYASDEQGSTIFITDKDGIYRTVETKEDITVYRVYGGLAMRDGSFTTSNPAINRLDVKQRLALKTEWGNTMEYEVKINIPAGTKINIGIAEKQISKIDGELCG